MAGNKKTRKVRRDTGDVPVTIWKRLRDNPALILAIAGFFGLGGEQVRGLLEADVPGYVAAIIAGALPLAYATGRWAKSQLAVQREMVETVKGLREDVSDMRAALDNGAEQFSEHRDLLTDHGDRLDELEAWQQAYIEKARRETGQVKP
jgi:hypothetical protein